MKEKPGKDKQQKRPYNKPELKQVPLRPEEAVLANCKTSGGGGPNMTCDIPSACSIVGS
jgi:hypothetical protein